MSKRLLPVVLAALALSGCTSFELTRVRNDVDRTPGVEVGDGFAVRFGRLTVGTLRTALRLSDGDEQAAALRAALGHIRKADVARYAVRRAPALSAVATPRAIRRYERKGWTRALTARDDDAAVWLMSRDDRDGGLRKLLLVTLLPDELIVARLDGSLGDAAAAFAREVEIAGLDGLLGRNAVADTTASPGADG